MDSVDSLLQLYDTDISVAMDAAIRLRFNAQKAARLALSQQRTRIEAAARNAPRSGRAAAALDWIQPCVDTGVVHWLSRIFNLIPTKVARVADSAAPLGARRNAVTSLCACGLSAFTLLEYLIGQLWNLLAHGDAQQKAQAQQLQATLAEREVLVAAAAAFRAWTLLTARLAQPSTWAALAVGGGCAVTSGCFEWAAAGHVGGAVAAAMYSQLTCSLLMGRLRAGGIDAPTAPTAGVTAAPLAAPLAELISALSSSGLIQAAAGMLLQAPPVDESRPASDAEDPGGCTPGDRAAVDAHVAAREVATSLYLLQCARACLLREGGGSASAPGVAELGRLLDSGEVTALCHAMLQRLAAHGGLQPPPPPGEEEVAEAGPSDIGAGGGAAEARAWWLQRRELQRWAGTDGSVTGFVDDVEGDDTVGWLEDDHCHAVVVSLGYWRGTELKGLPPGMRDLLAPPASAPPRLVVARLAARTAEALCRMYRGQGLGGAYGPGAPEWQFARSLILTEVFDFSYEASAVSEAEARACLPHWMEAAAWGLALYGEALVGAVERRGGADPNRPPHSHLATSSRLGVEAAGLAQLLWVLWVLAAHPQRGAVTLMGDAAHADLCARLHRAGLGASLDRALRLTFTLTDRGEAPQAAEWERVAAAVYLTAAPATVALLLRRRTLRIPILGPAAAAAAVHPGDASGVLVTAAKRAANLALQLKDLAEAGGAGVGASLVKLLRPCSAVLEILLAGASTLQDGDESEDITVGTSIDDARAAELLALSLSSACSLATQLAAGLATQLAAGLSAAESPPGERAGMPFSDIEEAVVSTARAAGQLAVACCPDRGSGLTEAQLLACQPHRLLAAAAALVCAIHSVKEVGDHEAAMLAGALTQTFIALATRPGLSARVRIWAAPPGKELPPAAAAAAADPAERGCLERPLRAAAEAAMLERTPPLGGSVLALLGVARSGDDDGGDSSDAFRDIAVAIYGALLSGEDMTSRLEAIAVPEALSGSVKRMSAAEAAEAAEAVAASAVLPAPLPLAAAALATRRLRMCANPRCANFGCAAEADLRLKQCAGCRAVRYCGAECQRDHWREHKPACAELQAEAAGALQG
ncbi:hypothetical protein GPECTOR_1g188 [Gonium pectorale]|uniref:MYND-type domain-containing protein n=1 Tax=Gonium pectorale TaxID=33097 RepID=A0A150H237_GONPE|nr:hypothetical protein GPECTOR_1g188 [Gonium pectorale]|eukprot:KXZ56216.1 hypothetical protein GPECTOR_1g188 [Gonium pectorale]